MHSVMVGWTDRELIDELCQIEGKLNDWEFGFVSDMAKRVVFYHEKLSPAMREKGEQMLEEQAL